MEMKGLLILIKPMYGNIKHNKEIFKFEGLSCQDIGDHGYRQFSLWLLVSLIILTLLILAPPKLSFSPLII